jgi:EAL domain-containing protein (putative c-di-GMP-specific phosphodiesterase class I)
MSTGSTSSAHAELVAGMETGAIRLAFQPQIDLSSQQIVGFEGVARWHHAKLGVLTPGLFLGLARREGLLSAISRALISDAAKAVCSWRARGHRVDIGVNLSAADMTDPSFGPDILALVRAHGALPHWLILEASEESLAFAGEPAFAGLETLAKLGFKIALDAKLPIVAVGAESQDAMDLCAQLGFDRLQGKIISMPVSLERSAHFLEQVGTHDGEQMQAPAATPETDVITMPVAENTSKPVSQSASLTMFSVDFVANDDAPSDQSAEVA